MTSTKAPQPIRTAFNIAWTAKGIAGRGVLIDYASWAKEQNISYERFAKHGISLEDVKAIAQMENLDFKPGDVLFLRTGYVQAYKALGPDRRKEVAAMKEWIGLAQGPETTEWLWDHQFAAVASDSPGFECRLFVHIHGGGFLNGSLDTETYICAATAVELGIVVVHPEYRHTNQVSFPVPHNDVSDAFEWIMAHCLDIGVDPASVVIGGQSAGSGLAASLVQREVAEANKKGRQSRVKGQILTIPWLAHPSAFESSGLVDESAASTTQCATAAGLSTEKLEWFASLLRAEDVFSDMLNPGLKRGPDLNSSPRSAFLVAGGDPLRDQGLLYARHLENAGFDGLKSAERFMFRLFEAITWCMDDSADFPGLREWAIE
ncbi:hypothetical protein SLS63_014146 [Diaporthe eres]|uniref:Alpha/beta hydrolase fold-3 domain-containing protein n=1 Tax=Diaporthe eres TaxID=83184 RepID=A0ABR1NL49_DIAER